MMIMIIRVVCRMFDPSRSNLIFFWLLLVLSLRPMLSCVLKRTNSKRNVTLQYVNLNR